MNNQETAHRWANNSYDRNGELNGSHFYATEHNQTIYSYGSHFPVARLTGNPAMPVLLTNRSYSNSTARHVSFARQAVRHMDAVEVANPAALTPGDIARNIEAEVQTMRHIMAEIPRARDKQSRIDRITATLANLDRYMVGEGVRLKKSDPLAKALVLIRAGEYAKLTEADKKAADKAAKARKVAEEKARVERLARMQENLADWLAGERVGYYNLGELPCALRLSPDRVEVQTSHGASVPVKHALRLFKLATACRESARAWASPPEKAHAVGHYTLTSIDTAGNVVVGCHSLAFDEMARIAPACREAMLATA